MKIGILTQPLYVNYGGILQAYALQEFVRRMGHEVLTIDYRHGGPFWAIPSRLGRRWASHLSGGRTGSFLLRVGMIPGAAIFLKRFIRENIRTTRTVFAPGRPSDFKRFGFEAFVVGSDQTWRPAYSPHLPTFFLDFLGPDTETTRVAYAASFGVDEWEFTEEMTRICAPLARRFHAISVREDSGIRLCERHFGVADAQLALDPTLLLSQDDYLDLIAQEEHSLSEWERISKTPERGEISEEMGRKRGKLLIYVLDRTPEKEAMISSAVEELELSAIEPLRTFGFSARSALTRDWVFPPVAEWLRSFVSADYVITDSFHGTAFAILFNKPFLTLGNRKRGMARFQSILSRFSLSDRLVEMTLSTDISEVLRQLELEIDWSAVNRVRMKEQERSDAFLKQALGKT